MIVFGIWAYLFVPETKGKSLEDMDQIFGVPQHSAQESSVEAARRVSEYADDTKSTIEQHEFSDKKE